MPICIIIFNAGYVTPVIRLSAGVVYVRCVPFRCEISFARSYICRACNAYLTRATKRSHGTRGTTAHESRVGAARAILRGVFGPAAAAECGSWPLPFRTFLSRGFLSREITQRGRKRRNIYEMLARKEKSSGTVTASVSLQITSLTVKLPTRENFLSHEEQMWQQ